MVIILLFTGQLRVWIEKDPGEEHTIPDPKRLTEKTEIFTSDDLKGENRKYLPNGRPMQLPRSVQYER